jgi:hypothetical protein
MNQNTILLIIRDERAKMEIAYDKMDNKAFYDAVSAVNRATEVYVVDELLGRHGKPQKR